MAFALVFGRIMLGFMYSIRDQRGARFVAVLRLRPSQIVPMPRSVVTLQDRITSVSKTLA